MSRLSLALLPLLLGAVVVTSACVWWVPRHALRQCYETGEAGCDTGWDTAPQPPDYSPEEFVEDLVNVYCEYALACTDWFDERGDCEEAVRDGFEPVSDPEQCDYDASAAQDCVAFIGDHPCGDEAGFEAGAAVCDAVCAE